MTETATTTDLLSCEDVTLSFGPVRAEVAFRKKTGSAGWPRPISSAWSE